MRVLYMVHNGLNIMGFRFFFGGPTGPIKFSYERNVTCL